MQNVLQPTSRRARLILISLVAVVVVAIRAQESVPPPSRDTAAHIGDTNLQLRTIERIRAGEPYYAAVGAELRKHHYPTIPIVNWRTPLHYEAVAALSVERAGIVLSALAITVIVTGVLVYARCSATKTIASALFLLGAMAASLIARPGGVVFPENWAGVIIALSLNAYVAKQWLIGAALGVLAVFVRELAAPYALVCGLLSFRARRRHESVLWVIGVIVYAVYYAAHAAAASAAIQPGDFSRDDSYIRWLGLPFVLSTLYMYGLLTPLPPVMTSIASGFGLAAVWAQSAPEQLKASLLLYFVLFCAVGQPFDFYWGYVTCAIWGHAFIHGAEGVRALVLAALPLSTRRASGTSPHAR
jgi:hypothetical protein